MKDAYQKQSRPIISLPSKRLREGSCSDGSQSQIRNNSRRRENCRRTEANSEEHGRWAQRGRSNGPIPFRISVFFVAPRVTRTPARKNYIRNPQFCTLGHQIPFLLKKRVRKPYTNSRQLDVFANFTAGILQKLHRHPDMKRITTGNQFSWGQMDQRRVVFLRSACLTRNQNKLQQSDWTGTFVMSSVLSGPRHTKVS